MPTVGYGSPKAVKGLNKFGFEEVIVFNKEDLSSIDAKTQTVVISKTVGARKRLEILNAAKEKKLSVSNFKNIDDAIKALTKEKKEKKPVKADKKTEKKTETAKKEAKKEDKKEA